MIIELWNHIGNLIDQGQLNEAITYLESQLASCKCDRFKSLIGTNFTINPIEISEKINEFIDFCESKFDVKSIYLEMNGFDINPDRWYFDFFAYKKYVADKDDLDWLAYWDSDDWNDITLAGLEETQSDFDWYINNNGYTDPLAEEAAEYAILLVMCKFAKLIEEAVLSGNIKKSIPILATAHEFDIIPRFMA